MKGLKEYIAIYGEHLTERLVLETTYYKWGPVEVYKACRDQVYYNVSKATLGDMTYLTNLSYGKESIRKRLKFMFMIIGNMKNEGAAFNLWRLRNSSSDIDLRNYI